MSQWQYGDSFGTVSHQSNGEMMQSWNQEKNNLRAQAEAWGNPTPQASSFHYDAMSQYWRHATTPANAAAAVDAPPLALRFDPKKEEEAPLATRVELVHHDRAESLLRNDAKESLFAAKDQPNTPLSRIYDILDVHSASSRWLEQRGYLEAFKSPACTLDLTFGTDGNKVGAVVTAPDGSKRTVVAADGGVSFQRLTAANGQELVKFLSSGQIVELNPKHVG